jgi:sulfur-oxidizing protein SoxZ
MAVKPVKMRGKLAEGVAEIKALMPHPMETGTRRTEAGELIPAHFIQEVMCEHNGALVLRAEWGTSVSKNPYFAFKVAEAKAGDEIVIRWLDNLGETSEGRLTLK